MLHKIGKLPSRDADNFTLNGIVLSEKHRRVAARFTEEIVVYDYRTKKKVAMDGWMADAFEELFHEQENWRAYCTRKSMELHKVMSSVEHAKKPEKST